MTARLETCSSIATRCTTPLLPETQSESAEKHTAIVRAGFVAPEALEPLASASAAAAAALEALPFCSEEKEPRREPGLEPGPGEAARDEVPEEAAAARRAASGPGRRK